MEKDLTVFASTITEWEQEVKEIESRIDSDKAKLAWLRQRLSAVALLSSSHSVSRLPFDCIESTPIAEMSVPQVILHFLQQYETSVHQLRLREAIERSDFPKEKLGLGGRYFYTVLSRLKDQGKIFRDGEMIGWTAAVSWKDKLEILMKKEMA